MVSKTTVGSSILSSPANLIIICLRVENKMSLYGCLKCEEVPCECGYDYKRRYNSPEEMANFLVKILGYRSQEEVNMIIQLLNAKVQDAVFTENEPVQVKNKHLKR